MKGWTTMRERETYQNCKQKRSLTFKQKGGKPRVWAKRSYGQCDQMDALFIQYLAIFNNDDWPKSIIIGPSRFKILPSTKLTLQK